MCKWQKIIRKYRREVSTVFMLLGLSGCDNSVGQLSKTSTASDPAFSQSLKVVLEHGPEPADYAAAMNSYRNGLLTTCERDRVQALGGTFNPELLPKPDVLVKAILMRTEEYFDPNRYAVYTYKYFISKRPRDVPDPDMCFPTPSGSYVLETIQIKTRCSIIDISLPTPDGLSPGTKSEFTMSEKDCAVSYQSNLERAKQERISAAGFSASDTVYGQKCVYTPPMAVPGGGSLPQGNQCLLLQMPFHPISGTNIVLKATDTGAPADAFNRLVIGDTTFGKTVVKIRASEVTLGAVNDVVFQVPQSAKSFKKPE